ncbi:MAG TPA: PIG-L family deacetylase [Prolixibacteraceae bacterium]
MEEKPRRVAVIVAHPDDETLWAGGMILSHPEWNWFIVCLCRRSDMERASKFGKAVKILSAKGIMGDLDDGPIQIPLDESEVENSIMELLPEKHYDLLITHNITGEYTRHLRHEEISKAVIKLWQNGKISASELWTFAYEDGNKAYFPIAIGKASVFKQLPQNIWNKKYNIITETYGFDQNSWEAKTVPHAEAFWQFKDHIQAKGWLY